MLTSGKRGLCSPFSSKCCCKGGNYSQSAYYVCVRERGETTGNGSGVGMTLLVLLFPEVVELICDGESERMDDGVLEKVAVPFV